MHITLKRLDEDSGQWVLLSSHVTNDDGRLEGGPALKGADFTVGTYEWTFDVGNYFASAGVATAGPLMSSCLSKESVRNAHLTRVHLPPSFRHTFPSRSSPAIWD